MIELYAKGTTDFTKHGIALQAKQSSVTWQENGRYDMDMTMPYNANIQIDYGMILRCPVPAQDIGVITLGTVSYWEISSGLSDVPLYKTVPVTNTIGYEPWEYGKEYAAGAKVTYDKKNYQAATAITGILTTGAPPVLPMNWTEIARTRTTGGEVLNRLDAGDTIVKTGDFNTQYMKAADTSGNEGFIEIAKCTDMSVTETRTVPAQSIREQSFTITEITKSTDGKTLTLHAEHISYQLGRTMLGDCNISRATPATALMFIRGAMRETYPGDIETNLEEEDATITGDFSWKNAQAAILDPKAGLLQATSATLIRNDLNVYILKAEEENPRYRITYGTNMKAVKWDGNAGDMVTRIYPIAKTADGNTLLLPEVYIDTVRTVPYIRPEALNTGLKVGAKEKQEDGTEIELDEDTVYARMREAASNRFNIDECDKATITLEVDWQHLPDTAEYAQYAALTDAAPGEWVMVRNGPLGIDMNIRMTGYTFDPILKRYTKGTFGKKKASSGIASYELGSGSVTGRVLGAGAVGSQNIQANCITAREIEANSITADKIASKSITTVLLAANCVTADEINAGSITAEKIAAYAITAAKIAAGAITADAIASNTIQAGHIMSDAITADKIAAGAVEATKIAAGAITTEKLQAGAVTAGKIAAGSINAAKIDANDLTAINATLGTADIADARIGIADINFAHIKDLSAGSAYLGQAVFQEAVGGKLYVPRLAVGYAAMIGATVGDLVIQASDGNYYGLDVDLSGNVTATQRTVTSGEIAAGHTTDGRTLVLGTDILATDLNTENIYAGHALMNDITANIINVDQLFAREATIGKINALDLSSNTYIQSTVGDWSGQSTITQTVNSINTRIATMGYGTFFYSDTEPSHENLVVGDVWIQPIADNQLDELEELTWNDIDLMTWDDIEGKYKMYVWTGEKFKLMFNNMIVSEMQTEISQNAYAITLKADATTVDTLSGQVSEFSTTLAVQAEAITAAVSSVNAKTANYAQVDDPADDPDITLSTGDIWTKLTGGSWDFIESLTWNELEQLEWDELAGPRTYIWDGTGWVLVSDGGAEITNRTMIDQTDRQVTILAEEQTTIGEQVYRNTASITVQTDRITQEVERATNAENGKISKTTQYQTADAIVSEAVSQSASAASGLYLAKTTTYQTPDAIVTEAVRQSNSAADGTYLKKTSTYQTAESIVSAAESYTNGQLESYSTISQTSSAISAYVTNNAYNKQSGIEITASGVTISGGKYIDIQSSGTFSVTAAQFGIRSDSSATYAIWAGDGTASSAPFRVKPDGTVYLTKLIAIGENGAESEVNLRTANLWKLNYQTIKSYTTTDGFCSSITLSNGNVVNFNRAAGVILTGSWSGKTFTVTETSSGNTYSETIRSEYGKGYGDSDVIVVSEFNSNHMAHARVLESVAQGGHILVGFKIDASGEYSSGVSSVGFDSETLWSSGKKTITLSNSKTKTVTIPDAQSWSAAYISNGQMAVSAIVGGKSINSGTMTDPGYSKGWEAYYDDSSNWKAATAANSWKAKIPARNQSGSTDWDCGAIAANSAGYTSGKNDWKPTGVSLGSNVSGTQQYTIPVAIGSGSHEDFVLNLQSVYNAGWNAALDAATKVDRYTTSTGSYGGGTTHYYKDGNNYISCGNGWYQRSYDNECYHLPDRKT